MPPRAASYLRISQDDTGEAAGVSRQREDVAGLIERRGWAPGPEFTDNDTSAAGKVVRRGFVAMLAAVERGEVDVIVGWALDRIVRTPRDRLALVEACQRRSVTVAVVRGSDMDPTTPAGRLTLGILGEVAQHEIDQKADRQKRAAEQRAAQGLPWCSRRPFGYSPDGASVAPTVEQLRAYYGRLHGRRPEVTVPGDVELVELVGRIAVEGVLLREAYGSVLAGASVRGIAAQWNAAGVLTSTGATWHGATVSQLLRNPRNAGIRTRGRGRVEVGRAAWPAIVDETTFRAVDAILSDPARRVGVGRERKYLLTGIALCGKCGKPMGSGRATSTGARTYTCKAEHHLSRAGDPVDELVSDLVVAFLSRPDAAALLVDRTAPDGAELNAEAVALRARLDGLAVSWADGALTDSQLRTMTERLRQRLGDVEARMTASTRAPVLAGLAGATDVAARWAVLPLDRRRAVVDALVTVTILPTGRGRGFNRDSVRVEQKG